jgi:2-polyprenyl-3-methyl-5-hydroxy-6-metoxy-1,4-benzoquinol methylase
MIKIEKIANKTMDRADLETPEAQKIMNELNELINLLKSRGLKISSWYGVFDLSNDPSEYINRGYGYELFPGSVDDKRFPWFLYWEIVWLILHNDFKPGQKILDIGGSSSLMSYYLAWKGLDVVTVDLNNKLVENADLVASQMNWTLTNFVMDARNLDLKTTFDHIISVCVYEHIPLFDRIQINLNLKKILKDNGTFSITIDYRNPSKRARINSPKDIKEQFVEPSGLEIRHNSDFYDNKKNYLLHPFFHKSFWLRYKRTCIRRKEFAWWEFPFISYKNQYTFAALFLKKASFN